MPKKSNKQLQSENAALRAQILQLSVRKDSNDNDNDSNSVDSSQSSNRSNVSQQSVAIDTAETSKIYVSQDRFQPLVSGGAVRTNSTTLPPSTSFDNSRLNRLEELVRDLTAAIARIDKSQDNAVSHQESTSIKYYTPAHQYFEKKTPSVLTDSAPKSKIGSIASDMSKESVSQSWTSLAATANAITKRFNEDTGLLIAPIDYKDMERYVIASFDIITVARKLITIKRYINNRPLKLLDIIAFIAEDIKPFILRAYHQYLIALKVPRAALYEEHELLQCLRESNDLGALIRAVAVNLDAKEAADYLLVLSKVRFWLRDYEAIVWSYLDASILVNWMFTLVREIIQLGILQFDDFESVITAHDVLKIILGTIKMPANPLTTFVTKFEKTSKTKYKQWSLLAALEDAQQAIVEYCRIEEASGYYQFVKSTNKFALKIYFRQNYGKGRTDGNFLPKSGENNKPGSRNKSFMQSPSQRPWNSSSPVRTPLLAALDVSADPYEYFDLDAVVPGESSEDEEEINSVVSDAEDSEESEMLLAALSGPDKAKLPCFAYFKAHRIHTEAGTIDISDPQGCTH